MLDVRKLSKLLRDAAGWCQSEEELRDALRMGAEELDNLYGEVETLRKINANLMGDDESVPRYTTKRLRLEIEKATDRFIAEFNEALSMTD